MKKTLTTIITLILLATIIVSFAYLNGKSFLQNEEVAVVSESTFVDEYDKTKTEFFCNGTKRLTQNEEDAQFVNYSKGYSFNVPKDVKFDFSLSPLFVDIYNEDFTMRVSREWSPYDDVEEYIDHYLNRFLKNVDWRIENDVTFKYGKYEFAPNAPSYIVERDDFLIKNMQNDNFEKYSFVIFRNDDKPFFCITTKYHDEQSVYADTIINNMINTFTTLPVSGKDEFELSYSPVIPENWTNETKELYAKLTNKDTDLMWGIFTKDIYGEGINTTIPKYEKELEYNFPVVLAYMHTNHEFPLDFMNQTWNDGKIVELTYQMTTTNNEKLMGYTPNIDIYRGTMDQEIRELARQAKAFGHPFLFRINNEMNSDWTSYGGVVNLRDPELFISNWRRFYDIFQEEGANNVIWVFNPNDRNYPPCDWNNSLAYYPGNEYVQMIGITGYNTGTYYAEEMGETWREFEDIYDAIYEEYGEIFKDFPWMITEFSSSSIGGDKVKWINSMFDCINKYENLKIAVWFDYADFDYREEKNTVVSRPYFLAETPETMQAFKNGIHKEKEEN